MKKQKENITKDEFPCRVYPPKSAEQLALEAEIKAIRRKNLDRYFNAVNGGNN